MKTIPPRITTLSGLALMAAQPMMSEARRNLSRSRTAPEARNAVDVGGLAEDPQDGEIHVSTGQRRRQRKEAASRPREILSRRSERLVMHVHLLPVFLKLRRPQPGQAVAVDRYLPGQEFLDRQGVP